MNGRKFDVLFEDQKYTDPRTGVEVVMDSCFTVWADADTKDTIARVEGVTNVYNFPTATQFTVYFDKRYDREYIKREIKAAILCAGES